MPIAYGEDPKGDLGVHSLTDADVTEVGPPPPRAPIAPRVIGDYRILREIGRGGMGVVYEAFEVSLGRRVALKVLSHRLGDARARRRFEREARSAGRLHHTNIVPVFGYGDYEGTLYYVMQCIHGVSLDAVFDESRRSSRFASTEAVEESSRAFGAIDGRSEGGGSIPSAEPVQPTTVGVLAINGGEADPESEGRPLPPPPPDSGAPPSPDSRIPAFRDEASRWKWVARLGVQAAGGLDYAHSQGVLHRDVKPSNLLLDDHGTVWVTDFGLAKWADCNDVTQSDDVVGTLRYMAPEALDGEYSRSGDVYGLGLTLYELLAGRPAFDERDRARLILQVVQAAPLPLRKLNPRIPVDLATITHKAIERRAADRYASAADVAADLTRFLEDRPVLARRAKPLERYWRWARRNPAIATLGAILTAVLLLATIGSLAAAGRFQVQAEAQRKLAEAARRSRDEEEAARMVSQRALRDLEVAREDQDRTLYDTRSNLAGAAWVADDYVQYLSLLGLMRPAPGGIDRRGWEWRHLVGLNSDSLREFRAPGDTFVAVAMRPDGSALATLSQAGAMRIWDARDGRELLTIPAPNTSGRLSDLRTGVLALAYSPDGLRLAGAGGDGAIGVYDAETGRRLQRLQIADDEEVSVLSLAWSPDGARLAAGLVGRSIRVWDVAAGVLDGGPIDDLEAPVAAVAFNPDGTILGVGRLDGRVTLWSLGAEPKRLHALAGHEGETRAVAFSPDGSRLASAGLDGAIRIWDVAAGTPAVVFAAHQGGVLCLTWPREGGWLISGGNDNAVRVWDPKAGRLLRKFLGHAEGVRAVAATPDGSALASASSEGLARLWDARRPSRPRSLEDRSMTNFGGAASCVAIAEDGRFVASGHYDGVVRVWDVASGNLLHRFKPAAQSVRALAFSPDGRRVASSSGEVSPPRGEAVVWSLSEDRPLATFRDHAEVVDALVFLDDRRVASAGGDRKIHIWDADTGSRIRTLSGHAEGVRRLALSRDGRTLASGADDATVRLWNVDDGRPGPVLAVGEDVLALAYAADGRSLAAAVRGGPIVVWNPSEPESPPMRLDGHGRDVLALAYSPDGRLISGGIDKCLRVWDVQGGRALLTLRDHGSAVTGLALSRDGGRLASSSFDHTIKLWEVPTLDAAGLNQFANAR